MHTVIKNVPLPSAAANRKHRGRRRKYPFESMDIGEMFFIPGRDKNNMTTHASAVGRKLERKFATRLVHMARDADGEWQLCTEDDGGATLGVGVWREA